MLCCMWEEDARQTIRELCQDRLIAPDAGGLFDQSDGLEVL